MSERASIFDNSLDFDVSGFAPKPERPATGTPPEAVRAVAEAAQFRSREPEPAVAKKKPAPKAHRRHRTGRNIQINIKLRPETLDAFYRIADSQKWVLGETLERAVAALERELATK
jgi:hypothetical protein